MKKRTLIVGCIIAVFAAVSAIVVSLSSDEDFLNENLEALLSGESVSGVIECDGDGSLYCPLTHTNKFREIRIYQ